MLDERLFGGAIADSETGVATSRRQVEHLASAASHAAGAAQQLMEDQPELAAADLRRP